MKNQPVLKTRGSGFTLIEVMVAAAILSMLMLVLLGTLSTTLSLWRNTESKSASDREARAVGLQLTQDLDNIVMMTNTQLWPTVIDSDAKEALTLQFLTRKPADYDTTTAGDVIFVEYWVDPELGQMMRSMKDSQATYDEVLLAGAFPASREDDNSQMLASNLLSDSARAVKGMELEGEVERVKPAHFAVLNQELETLAGSGAYDLADPSSHPVTIEINFAATDPDTFRNASDPDLGVDYPIRNAGLYTTRISLPEPPPAPSLSPIIP